MINKFDIQDENRLSEVESVITTARAGQWLSETNEKGFDFAHYKAIHRYLFSEFYDWAGQIRTVNISKQGTPFCPANEIESRALLIFRRLAKQDFFRGLSHTVFLDEIVDFYCTTNELHPFREGNGRTQRIFLTQLICDAGYPINFHEVDMDLLMVATIQSANGITDLLKRVFGDAIK